MLSNEKLRLIRNHRQICLKTKAIKLIQYLMKGLKERIKPLQKSYLITQAIFQRKSLMKNTICTVSINKSSEKLEILQQSRVKEN